MKRLFFAIAVAATAFAVNANAQISVGAGYANETVVSKDVSVLGENYAGYSWKKSRLQLDGFYLEAAYNWDLAEVGPGTIALQPGIRYSCLTNFTEKARTNVRYSAEGAQSLSAKGYSKKRLSDHFIDVPVHVKYAYDFVPGIIRAYAFAGPVVSLGLAAKEVNASKSNVIYDDNAQVELDIERYNGYTGRYYLKTFNEETQKYDVDKGKDDAFKSYTMFDLKLALGVGVTLSEKVDVKLGYNIGLLNRSFIKNHNDVKYFVHSNVFYFGVAYNF